MTELARRAVSEARSVAVRQPSPTDAPGRGHYLLGCPIRTQGSVIGVVAVDVTARSDASLKVVLRHLQWGSGWLEMFVARRDAAEQHAARDRLRDVLETVASALHHERFAAAAIAFVTTLATKLGCDRVSLGFVRGARVRVHTVSHTAELRHRTNLVRAIGAAMDEAIDQKGPVLHPAPPDQVPRATRAHRELGDQHGTAVLTVPFAVGTRVVGALTLERPSVRPFDNEDGGARRGRGRAGGPHARGAAARRSVARRQGARRGPGDSWRISLARATSALKLGAVAAVAVVALLWLATGEYRVAARAVMEAHVQRAAVAPFNGYVREAPARPATWCAAGQLLAALDDRELRLERAQWAAQQDQLRASSSSRRSPPRNAAQARRSPPRRSSRPRRSWRWSTSSSRARASSRRFDGVVVSGDLSQSLGAPVERGQVLFEIAPLDGYRVVAAGRRARHRGRGSRASAASCCWPPRPDSRSAFAVRRSRRCPRRATAATTSASRRRLERRARARCGRAWKAWARSTIDERRLVWIWTAR